MDGEAPAPKGIPELEKEIEEAIETLKAKIASEGKTDAVEKELDELEDRINKLKEAGTPRAEELQKKLSDIK